MHNPQDTTDVAVVADPFAMLINPQAVLQAIDERRSIAVPAVE